MQRILFTRTVFEKKDQHIKYEESFKEGYAVNLLTQITL